MMRGSMVAGCRTRRSGHAFWPFGCQGREAQEPSIRLPPSVPNPGEQQAILLASSPPVRSSCRQKPPVWVPILGRHQLSTSQSPGVCRVSVGCLLRLRAGLAMDRGECVWLLGALGVRLSFCRGKWRLKVRQATMLSFAIKSRKKMSSNFRRTDENLEESLVTKSSGSSFPRTATAWI